MAYSGGEGRTPISHAAITEMGKAGRAVEVSIGGTSGSLAVGLDDRPLHPHGPALLATR
jgi:hypothetical protein